MRKRTQRALTCTRITPATHPALCTLLDFAAQTPPIDWREYPDQQRYLAALRRLREAWLTLLRLLDQVDRLGIADAEFIAAAHWVYAGRYTWDGVAWHFTPGQDFCTEYRQGAIALLEAVIAVKAGGGRKGNDTRQGRQYP
ncbi:MAG: hypothetical protein ACYDBB_04695 [Armatimonadota bacterium]